MWFTEKRLAVVFWVYFVEGLSFNSLTLYLVVVVSIAAPSSFTTPIFISMVILVILYYIWSTISVWKCAANVSWKPWGYIARFVVLTPYTI